MRIPPSRLVSVMMPGTLFEVRTSDYGPFDRAMEYTEALAAAIRGEVEAIATRSGNIKCLRLLPENERQPAPEFKALDSLQSKAHSLNAITNLGAYQQELSTGKVWALKMCKALDGALARA